MNREEAKQFVVDVHRAMHYINDEYDTRKLFGFDEDEIVRWSLFEQ
jgi:hypothetical protein